MQNKIEEKFKVTFEEEEEQQPEKEFTITLNTLTSSTATFLTPPMIGDLQTLLLIAPEPVDVKIWLEGWPDMELLNVRQISGDRFLPLRISPIASNGETFNFGPQKWTLNDRIMIEISGGMNREATFIFRLE